MNSSNRSANIALVGATGLVGREFLKLVEERDFPFKDFYLFSSKKSAGTKLKIKGKIYTVKEFNKNDFQNIDLAFFATSAEESIKYIGEIKKFKTVCIDNSSAFRLKKNIPLVVPEINFNTINNRTKIIANPNCSTIQLVLVLNSLLTIENIHSVNVSTYQAISGAGKDALTKFFEQKDGKYKKGEPVFFNNLIQHIGNYKKGWCEEENKIINETRKILNNYSLNVSATTIRVPIINSHTEVVTVEFKRKINFKKIVDVLQKTPYLILLKETDPISVSGTNLVFVSRLRKDKFFNNRIHFIITADNLRIGAALNGIKIAERIIYES
ncbi:MAG: aspartate-semialdehyde dehydrogenase [candidate division WOR-3 bacterium]